jgi:hypothetical protein
MFEKRMSDQSHRRPSENRSRSIMIVGVMCMSFFFVMPFFMAPTAVAVDTERIVKTEKLDELCLGTWINENYDAHSWRNAKMVLRRNGTYKAYDKVEESGPVQIGRRGKMEIKKAWIESDGSYWYMIFRHREH